MQKLKLENKNMKPLILLFGGTGKTGRHIIPFAISNGYKVRAFVRSKSKLVGLINLDKNDLEIIEGDIKNEKSIINACKGNIKYVIFVAGLPNFKWNQQEKGVMSNGIRFIHKGMIKYDIKRILYLAGTVNPAPFQNLSFGINLLKLFLIVVLGDKWNIIDNDSVVSFLSTQKNVEFIIIRPLFMLGHNKRKHLNPSDKLGGIVSFLDLGEFTVRTVNNDTLVSKYLYVS